MYGDTQGVVGRYMYRVGIPSYTHQGGILGYIPPYTHQEGYTGLYTTIYPPGRHTGLYTPYTHQGGIPGYTTLCTTLGIPVVIHLSHTLGLPPWLYTCHTPGIPTFGKKTDNEARTNPQPLGERRTMRRVLTLNLWEKDGQ